jgi:hypothetical protein
MRFFSEQMGFIWEFNSLWEYVKFMFGRLLGIIIFFGLCFLGLIVLGLIA